MDISNKTLAMFLIAAMVISLTGTLVSLTRINQLGVTGFATENATGTAAVDISTEAALVFSYNTIDWGTGTVNATTQEYCNLTSNESESENICSDTTYCIGFNCSGEANSAEGYFILNNTGNEVFTNVTIEANKNASGFLGGSLPSGPSFKFKVGNVTGNTGDPCTVWNHTTYTEMDASSNGSISCYAFNYQDGQDEIRMDVFISIPYDASGTKSATFTARGHTP